MGVKTNTTIERNGKKYNYYRITRTIGHENGKPIKKQFTGSSKREAEEKYRLFLEQKNEKTMNFSPRSFGELADYYVENILSINSKYSKGTRDLYRGAYNSHVKDSWLAEYPMSSLQSHTIQKFYNELNINQTAFKTLHKFMKGFINWANINGYSDDLLKGVIIPSKPSESRSDEIVVWTDEELKRIMESEPEYKLHPLILFAVYTGMRISELIGLRWENINQNAIVVSEQIYRGVTDTPKGGKSRIIPLHPKIKEYVKANRSEGLVFTNINGNPLDYRVTTRSLERFYKRNGIEPKKFHAYRATFCTNLCKNGVPIQVASKIMGHSSIEVTAKYYTSININEMKEAIEKL